MTEFDDYIDNPSAAIRPLTFLISISVIFMFFSYTLDGVIRRKEHEAFQRGITNSVKAYSTEFALETKDLALISEGYLTDDDLNVYKIKSNPVNLDLDRASKYFFNVMEINTPYKSDVLKAHGIYMVSIVTKFNPSPTYIVNILKDGNVSMLSSNQCSTTAEVQNVVEATLGIKTDIAVNLTASVSEAQDYDRANGKTGGATPQNTYSTYSTVMCVAKDVPIRGLMGDKLEDVVEMQTYSVQRGK